MNYEETLNYLYSQLPMFQRIGSAAYKADLDNTIAICRLLDNPEKKFRSVHVAGTNGKGSTSHLLASVLQCTGLKVGLYTSPHLKDFRERIRINGAMIPQQNVVDFVAKHKKNFEKIQPSFFEMTVGLAFDYFAKEKVDVAVIEVGLGGRLDSTNVIMPLLSVITNISFDHVALLGDTLEKIAAEKAGIIKAHVPVVVGETTAETKKVFLEKAQEAGAAILFAGEVYKVANIRHVHKGTLHLLMDIEKQGQLLYRELESELPGLYQRKNMPAVIAALDILKRDHFTISEPAIRRGIAEVIRTTGLLGRWQVISEKPLVIADTGHNEAGIREVLEQIGMTPHKQLHFVLGMVNDKDISGVLQLLPKDAVYYFCKAKIPRAMEAKVLAAQAQIAGLKGKVYGSVAEALDAAKKNAAADDLVFAGGSTFTVAEII